MRNRNTRRTQQRRVNAKAKRIYPDANYKKLANNLAACSCYGCGNMRQMEGLTPQELRFADRAKYEELVEAERIMFLGVDVTDRVEDWADAMLASNPLYDPELGIEIGQFVYGRPCTYC